MSSSDFRLKLVFRQTVGGGLYTTGETNGVPNVNASDENHEHFSIMQNLDDYTYEFTYGSSTFNAYHFVMISYDKVTNNGIDSYIQKKRQEWIQNTNPNTTSANPGYTDDYLQPDYTTNVWAGLAISDQSSNTILDGSPGHGSWWYSIGTITLHNGGIPSIDDHVADRVELYMFYNPNEMKNDFSSSTLSVSGTLDIGGEFFSQDLIGEIKMFPPTVNHFSLFESFLPCDGRTIKSIHLKGQYQKLIDYLKGSTGHSSVQIPNYNSNHYLICDTSKSYNDSLNTGSVINVDHIPSHNHSVTATGVGYNSMNLAYRINNSPNINVSTNFNHNFENEALGKRYNDRTDTHDGGVFSAGDGNRHSRRHDHAVQRSYINSTFQAQRKFQKDLSIQNVPTLDNGNSSIPSNFDIDISGINTQNIQYNDSSISTNTDTSISHVPSSVGMLYYIRYK
jgi:hypothetical protein